MPPLLLFLETGKHHFGAGNVLLRIRQVDVESVFAPSNTLVLVLFGVSVALSLSGFAAKEPVKVGTYFVFSSGFNSMALSAASGKNLLSGFNVSHFIAADREFFLHKFSCQGQPLQLNDFKR